MLRRARDATANRNNLVHEQINGTAAANARPNLSIFAPCRTTLTGLPRLTMKPFPPRPLSPPSRQAIAGRARSNDNHLRVTISGEATGDVRIHVVQTLDGRSVRQAVCMGGSKDALPAPIEPQLTGISPQSLGLEGYEEMQTVNGIVFVRQGWWCRIR